MSASDAYVEWWAVGMDPVVMLDRLLDAGLWTAREARSGPVDVLDAVGESIPTSLPEFRDVLRLADQRLTFERWFDDGENLIVSRRRALVGDERRVVDCATCYLDAFSPDRFDQIVEAMASLVTDFPDRTVAWVLDGSNDTAAFDWAPVAGGAPVAAPWAPVVVTRAGSPVTAPGRDWAEGVPAPGLRSTGWPVVEGGDPVSWYWWCRR